MKSSTSIPCSAWMVCGQMNDGRCATGAQRGVCSVSWLLLPCGRPGLISFQHLLQAEHPALGVYQGPGPGYKRDFGKNILIKESLVM